MVAPCLPLTYGLKLRRGIPRGTGAVLRLSLPVLPVHSAHCAVNLENDRQVLTLQCNLGRFPTPTGRLSKEPFPLTQPFFPKRSILFKPFIVFFSSWGISISIQCTFIYSSPHLKFPRKHPTFASQLNIFLFFSL